MISQYFTCGGFWLFCSPHSNHKNVSPEPGRASTSACRRSELQNHVFSRHHCTAMRPLCVPPPCVLPLRLRSSGLHRLFWPSTKLAGRKRFFCATKVRFAGLLWAARQAISGAWLYGSGKCSVGRLGNWDIKPAVKEAIKHGADALVLLASGTNISGSTTFSSGQWGSNTTTTGGIYGNYFNARSRTTGGGFGSTTTLPIRKGYARVIAIQFL